MAHQRVKYFKVSYCVVGDDGEEREAHTEMAYLQYFNIRDFRSLLRTLIKYNDRRFTRLVIVPVYDENSILL